MAEPSWAQRLEKDTLNKVTGDTISQSEGDNSINQRIEYEAEDSIVAMASGKKAILYGKAKLTYDDLTVKAEVMELDYSRNILTAYGKKDSTGKLYGNPVFKDNEQEISAEKIMYNLKTRKGKIFGALTKQGEMFVYGNEIKKDSNNVIYMKGMKCLPCEEQDARTMFRATKAKIIPNDKIVTGPMYLEIGGVPTPLALPFGFFPNTKKSHSGIIIPTVGSSANRGFFLRDGGYYWGISDKTEMRIMGDYYTNGTWGIRTFNSYNVLYKATGALNFGFSKTILGDKDVPQTFSSQNSFNLNWMHVQDNRSNPSLRFSSNVNVVKNQYNKYNSFNSGQYLTNTFQSNINLTKSFKWSSLSVNAMQSQNTITRLVNLTFPSLTFNVNRFYPLRSKRSARYQAIDKLSMNYLLEAQNTLSGTDSTMFKGNFVDRMRNGIKNTIPIATNFNLFRVLTITPQLNVTNFMYGKSIKKEYTTNEDNRNKVDTITEKGFTSATQYNFSTGINTKVYFDYAFRSGKVSQIRHLVVPTIYYNYNPDFSDEKFGYWKTVQTDSLGHTSKYSIYENSIYGGPLPGPQNALGLSIANNIEAKLKHRTDTGVNYIKTTVLQELKVNALYNFAVDSFQMSNINLTGRSKVLKYFDVNGSAVFDPYAYNAEQKRINTFVYTYNGKLVNFRTASIAVNSSIGSNMVEALKKSRQAPNMTNSVERGAAPVVSQNEQKLVWNLNANYSMDLDNTSGHKLKTTQNLRMTGDIKPTKYWKLGLSSGFDLVTKKITYTSINLYRDLKCWEVSMDWVPFGFNKRYSIFLHLKTPTLSSIKIPRQKGWYDNIQ